MSTQRPLYATWVVVALMCLPFIPSCAVQQADPRYTRDGKIYGTVAGAFRHRWWNYYERGLSFAEGQFFPEAIHDLKTALGKRDKDQRMARTYGMHFVDYFPHRELGIIYYLTGNLQDAKNELEASLHQFPTAKARFYLDRVRKGLMEKAGRKASPAAITLDIPEDPLWTREDPVIISGVAEDDEYVCEISVKGLPFFMESSMKRVLFKKALPLSQGKHRVEIAAENLMGARASRNVVIHVDREGPVITLEKLEVRPSIGPSQVVICGTVFDDAGVAKLSAGGRAISVQKAQEVAFSETIPTDAESVEIVAVDRLGNRTSALIELKDIAAVRGSVMLASAGADLRSLNLARLFGPKDTRPPKIQLKGWTRSQTVYLDKVYIEGKASDDSRIERLTIDGTPILRRKGRCILFGHLAELEEGENRLAVEATDEAGNTAAREIIVIRRIPKALQLAERLSLTVLPFEQKGEIPESSLFFQDGLIDALVDQNRFRLVERDKLDAILQEQKLSRTKLIDPGTALRLGKLVAAQTILTGSIIETRTGIEIVARMIDTETSDILATSDVYGEVKELPEIGELAEGMAVKFHREFPLLDGIVIQRKGNEIFTDMGKGKIKPLRRLIVYHEVPIKHPITGKTLGSDNQIRGHARVSQVVPDMSKAEIISGEPSAIQALDKVITE